MAKTPALGTKLYVEVDSEFVAVGNLTSITVPGPEKGEIDVTDFDSVAIETLPTLPDNGSMDFSGFYNDDDEGQNVMFDDANDADAPVRNYRIDFVKQGQSFSFAGFAKSFKPSAGGPREAYTFTGTLRVSGAVTKGVIS